MERVLITPKKKWITIVDQEVYEYKYGYKGEVSWFTNYSDKIKIISSINLQNSSAFNKLFEIEETVRE
tara:strand:+ start:430 stop:633 length:204 start_codon:yes stop_codon:yes gene_type:complete